MDFKNIFNFDWGSNDGTEPSDQLKASGFTGGYKPPAGVFNWFFRKFMKGQTELQKAINTVESNIPTKTSELTNDSGFVTGAELPEGVQVVDNLTSTLTNSALSANQGRVLKSEVDGKAAASHTHATATTTAAGFMSASDRSKLDGIATGANKYTHPAYTAKTSGLYKVTVDSTGHISGATAVTKSDITALGIPAQDTNTTYGNATTSAAGLMSAADKSKLNGIDTALAGKANSSHSHSTTDISGLSDFVRTNGTTENTASSAYAHAEGYATNAEGSNSHSEGYETTASGNSAHSEGGYTTASGETAHAEGTRTTASGSAAHAEGGHTTASGDMGAHAGGNGAIASGNTSFAHGYMCEAKGTVSTAFGEKTVANGYQFVCGQMNNYADYGDVSVGSQSSNHSIFIIGNGTNDTTGRSNALRTTADGQTRGLKAFLTSGADFPEYYEWLDGNPNNEDRRGRIVTLEGEYIKLANSNDDYILGVISVRGGFIGNAASECWQGQYLKDVFGEWLTEEVEIPESTNEETGEVIPAHKVTRYVINPDYNPEQEYISREFRKEWSPVGLVGQVIVVDDGTCQVNGYCKPSTDGIATAAESGYRVMKRIDDSHIEVTIK